MVSCCVKGCIKTQITDKNNTFFTEPPSVTMRKQWREFAGVEENQKNIHICSDHFEPSCFKKNEQPRRLLYPGAVPTILPHSDQTSSRKYNRKKNDSFDRTIELASLTENTMPTIQVIDGTHRSQLGKQFKIAFKVQANCINSLKNTVENDRFTSTDINENRIILTAIKKVDKALKIMTIHGLLLDVGSSNVGNIVSSVQMAIKNKVEKVNLKQICRVCLIPFEPSSLFNMFYKSSIFQNLSISSAISDCFNIELQQENNLPSNVCKNCASTILLAFTFKQCILKSQEFLKNSHTVDNQANNNFDLTHRDNFSNDVRINNVNREKHVEIKSEAVTVMEDFLPEQNDVSPHLQIDHDYCKIEENREIENCPSNDSVPFKELTKPVDGKNKVLKNANTSKFWWSKKYGPPYICQTCGANFGVLYKAFYNHVKKHRMSAYPCEICGKSFTGYKMSMHLKFHRRERSFWCTICSRGFYTRATLKRHILVHTGEKPFMCDVCGKGFKQSSSLRDHTFLHKEEFSFVCEICGMAFKSICSLNSHMKRSHNKYVKKDSNNSKVSPTTKSPRQRSIVNKCLVCLKKFSVNQNYNIHMLWHQVQSKEIEIDEMHPQVCSFCSNQYIDPDIFATHILTHMISSSTCTYCGKVLSTKASLKLHIRKHTGELPFTCDICLKKFSSQGVLQQHLKIHTGERPYECKICFKRFLHEQKLKYHMNVHTREKKYVCPYCGKTFSFNGNLTVHKRRHTGETPYICIYCQKGFYDSSSMKKHIRIAHM